MPQRADTRSILLVEDNPDDRARIHRMLRGHRRQYQIVDCASGAEAVELIERQETHFDCVLLDHYLADMTGDQVLLRLRAGNARLPVAVSMLTGIDDDDVAALALALGAEDYLLKDEVTPHALVRSIENVSEKFEIRRQLDFQRAEIDLRNERVEALRAELETRLEQLIAATQARDRFVAMMSHEMRTPLNAIIGYTALLELEIEGQTNEGHRRNLDRIRIGSRRLLDLVNDVLDLARADARKLELNLLPVDANDVIEEITSLLENLAVEKGLTLTFQRDVSLPNVCVDAQRLGQIVTNLVSNAIKFTEQGSIAVTARTVADGGVVAVTVSDSGIGIEPHVITEVFKEFYQADNALTRRYGGSGLGLAIAKRLARAMGGDIDVASTAGKGSVFTLTLPVA